jgi:hypothetical protein
MWDFGAFVLLWVSGFVFGVALLAAIRMARAGRGEAK